MRFKRRYYDGSRPETYMKVSVSDLLKSEARARWKSVILSLMRYARESNCCLRNWISLVLPVWNAFFKRFRIWENDDASGFRTQEVGPTYGSNVMDRGRRERGETLLLFALSVEVVAHLGSC